MNEEIWNVYQLYYDVIFVLLFVKCMEVIIDMKMKLKGVGFLG